MSANLTKSATQIERNKNVNAMPVREIDFYVRDEMKDNELRGITGQESRIHTLDLLLLYP